MTAEAIPVDRAAVWRERAMRFAAPLGAVLAVLALWGSIGFLGDLDGPENALIGLFNALGLTDQANGLARDGLDPLLSKLIIAVVGLALGIGAIWLIYLGAHAFLELLGPRWHHRLVPWLFIGPALLVAHMAARQGVRVLRDRRG